MGAIDCVNAEIQKLLVLYLKDKDFHPAPKNPVRNRGRLSDLQTQAR